jgi:hypothetical protein
VGTQHLVTLSHGYMLTLTCKRLFQSSDDDRANLLVRMDQEQRLVQFCELEERSTRERFWAVERLKSDAGMFSYLSNAVVEEDVDIAWT